MKIRMLFKCLILLSCAFVKGDGLSFRQGKISHSPHHTLTPLTLHNTYTQPIESARLWAFALDGEGKVVGQRAIWLNGEPGQPWLEADAETEFNVVLRTTSEAVSTQVVVTRIILADGTVINPQEGDEAMPEPKPFVPASD